MMSDTAHAGDKSPAWAEMYDRGSGYKYRDLIYIKNECTKIAAQLQAIASGGAAEGETS